MDDSERRSRREGERDKDHDRRRLIAAVLIGLVVLVVLGIVVLGGGSGSDSAEGGSGGDAGPELPRGGRTIFPRDRVVAYYGNPRADSLGVLGIGSPDREAKRLERQAKPYERPGRPVLPALELISTLVVEEPGEDGEYSDHEEASVIRRYLRVARAHKMLLILDIQPGYSSFVAEAKRLEPFLKQPDVSLALDPEWSLDSPVLPGQEIGSTKGSIIDEVSAYLSGLVRRYDLPQKLLVVHRFTEEELELEGPLRQDPGVAEVINVDGFGTPAAKISKYKELTAPRKRALNGFKLFYEEDTDMMKPAQVMRLRPQPDLIVYE